MPQQEFDQVLVFTHIKLHNQGQAPLFLRHVMTSVTVDDGVHSSYAAIPSDYERLFIAYPELAFLHGKPLPNEPTIPAGQTVEGDVVSSFRMTRQQWDGRKGLDYGVGFQYQPDLKLTPGVPVTTKP
jgi:hypothetical protein